jgi:hypothetical protein
MNFIPIFLLFALLTYSEKFIHISGSVLGKLVAVFIILFYSSIDIIHGILAAGLIILYYQSDIVEGMITRNDYESLPTHIESVAVPVEFPTLLATDKSLSYLSQYEVPILGNTPGLQESEKADFRKKYCKKGHLTTKEQNVRTDMTEHIYPEVSYVSDKCNICDSTCNFIIKDNMITTEVKEGFAPISCRQ